MAATDRNGVDAFRAHLAAGGRLTRGQRRALHRACYEEAAVSGQFSGLGIESAAAPDGVPGRFVAVELGYAWQQGPCIEDTLASVDRVNRHHRAEAELHERQERATLIARKVRDADATGRTLRDWQRLMRAMAKRGQRARAKASAA